MGQRRIRCLKALGHTNIVCYDTNIEAAKNVAKKYNTDYSNFVIHYDMMDNVMMDNVMMVCTPPLTKQKYIDFANYHNIPCFIEADIKCYEGNYYPSSTMRFHPAIQKIKKALEDNMLGKIYTFSYHMGQHIKDWHPNADYSTYYAVQKESGAAREMLCFELSWLSYFWGKPTNIKGFIRKTLNDSDILADDVYASVVTFNKAYDMAGTVLIDIVSRPAVRELRIVGEKGILLWNWQDNFFSIQHNDCKEELFQIPHYLSEEGYNQNIPEHMYIEETKAIISNIQNNQNSVFYNHEEEKAVIDMLYKIEIDQTIKK